MDLGIGSLQSNSYNAVVKRNGSANWEWSHNAINIWLEKIGGINTLQVTASEEKQQNGEKNILPANKADIKFNGCVFKAFSCPVTTISGAWSLLHSSFMSWSNHYWI